MNQSFFQVVSTFQESTSGLFGLIKGDLPGTPKDMGPPKMVSGTHTIPISLGSHSNMGVGLGNSMGTWMSQEVRIKG